jgi:hypothetical protein
MKYLIFLIAFIGIFGAQAQTHQPDEPCMNQLDENNLKQGHWQFLPPNSFLIYDVYYKDDTMQGPCKLYTQYGVLQESYICRDGKYNGLYKKYYTNGKIMEEGVYDDGDLTGIVKQYWENGKMKCFAVYVAGDLDGVYISYSEKGTVRQVSHYESGVLNGTTVIYSKKGNVAAEIYYKNGCHYKAVIYDKKGNVAKVMNQDDNIFQSSLFRHIAGFSAEENIFNEK